MTIILNDNLREIALQHLQDISNRPVVTTHPLFTGQLAWGLPMPGSEEVVEEYYYTRTDRKGCTEKVKQEVKLYEQYMAVRGGGYKWLLEAGYDECRILGKNQCATLVFARWGITQLSGTNLPGLYQKIMANPWMKRLKFHSVLID